MKKLSIKDVAKELGISTATISYILNGKSREKRISLQLEEKVLKYVKKYNYRPNQLAKSLRTGKTKIICLMVEDIADTFFAGVAGLIEEMAFKKGYKIIYCSTKNETKKAKELISIFKERNVDGYIITPPKGIEEDILSLINNNIPVVLFDRYYKGLDCSYVGMDNYQSTFDAVKYLYSQNFKNIGFVTLDSTQIQMQDRLKGYKAALAEQGSIAKVCKISYTKRATEEAKLDIELFIKSNPNLDALFFATNYLGITGLEVLNNLDLKICQDFGLIVFDDNDLFRIHQPTITAVTQPVSEMSSSLIKLLFEHLQSLDGYHPKQIVVPATLTKRASSQKIF